MNEPSIYFGDLSLEKLGLEIDSLKKRGERILLITTRDCLIHHEELIHQYFPQLECYILPSGEEAKSLKTYEALINKMLELPLGRRGALIGVGGGSLLDAVGFAAATYARGISFYSVPTTLLAMADAAIGGKTALNFSSVKNAVGAFYPPVSIAVAPIFLKSLPHAEWASGMAEVIKIALLGAEGVWQDLLTLPEDLDSKDPKFLSLLQRAISYKLKVVRADPYERGAGVLRRSFLNLGHTFGHALEGLTHYKIYRHGEAVAIGLMMALSLSELEGAPVAKLRLELRELLKKFSLPFEWPEQILFEDLLAALKKDKKSQSAWPSFILLHALGKPYLHSSISLSQLKALLTR